MDWTQLKDDDETTWPEVGELITVQYLDFSQMDGVVQRVEKRDGRVVVEVRGFVTKFASAGNYWRLGERGY